MYGFQPKHARGKPAQALADGGLVHSITGMLGMRKRTPEEMLAADAKVQERNREAAARVAARAKPAQPAAPAEGKAVSDYAGMSAMQRREQAAELKDGGTVGGFKPGGLIRGPGTGTSDSIETEKRPGTFIMPADSTQAITPEVLAKLGATEEMPEGAELGEDDQGEGGKVPVRLSNGEFDLPPEQVQALGEAVLTVMRNATHQPADGQKEVPTGKGFTPHQFFSGGGTVKPRGFVAGKGTATSDSIPARLSNGEYVLPADTVRAVGVEALDALRESTHKPVKGEQANAARGFFAGGTPGGVQKAYDDWQATKTPWYMPTPRGNMEERIAEANYIDALKNQYSAQQSAPTLTSPEVTPEAPAQNPTDARLAAGTQTSPMSGAMNQPKPQPKPQPDAQGDTAATTAREVVPGVFKHGRGQYSDQSTGMAMPPGFTGQPNAQNMAAADALVARQTPAGFQPAGSQPAGVQAPVVRNSTNDWAARNNLRNLEVSASSITNQPGFSRGGRGYVPPAVAAYQAALQTDAALQQAQPGMDQTAMRENAGITREGMQQAGATGRTAMQEQGSNARDAERNAISRDELGLRRTAAGFQNRAAQRMEDLSGVLLDPNATPEQRAVAQRNLAALSGKTAADRMQTVALPDTTNEMGQVVRGGQALVRVLEDGSVQQVPIGTQAPAPQGGLPKVTTPQDLAALKSGTKFVDSNGVERIKK